MAEIITIDNHKVLQFADNVRAMAQQKVSKLYGFLDHSYTLRGEAGSIDTIGKVDPVQREGRYADTRLQNVDYYVRWYIAQAYDWATLIDSQDKLQMLYDPTGKIVQEASKGFARLMDRVAIAAAFANVTIGKERSNTVTWASQTGQIIVHGSTGLTLDKLRALRKLLGLNEEEDGAWVFVGSPEQRDNLLATTQVTSSDYNSVKALVHGEVNSFMGFDFVWSNFLPKSSTTRSCLAFKKNSGIALIEPEKFQSRSDPRPDKNYITQVWTSCTVGAVRVAETEVAEVQCTETA